MTAEERHSGQLLEFEEVLPRLRAAMKELSEAEIVVSHMQMLQKETLNGHAEWLQEHEKRMAKMAEEHKEHEKRMDAMQKETAKLKLESDQRGRDLDERIAKLVVAIGEFINRKQ